MTKTKKVSAPKTGSKKKATSKPKAKRAKAPATKTRKMTADVAEQTDVGNDGWYDRPLGVLLELIIGLVRRLDDIVGWVMIAFGFVSILSLLGLSDGYWTRRLSAFLQAWLGWGAYLVPLTIVAIGVMIVIHNMRPYRVIPWRRVIAAEIAVVLGLALLHLLLVRQLNPELTLYDATNHIDAIKLASDGGGGGLLGWAVAWVFARFLRATAILALSLTLVLALAFMLRIRWTFPLDILIWVQAKIAGNVEDASLVRRFDDPELDEDILPRKKLEDLIPNVPAVKAAIAAPKTAMAKAKPAKAAKASKAKKEPNYKPRKRPSALPDLMMLDAGEDIKPSKKDIAYDIERIETLLDDFNIPATVVDSLTGPSVTQYLIEPGFFERPGPDGTTKKFKVRISQISNLANDLALALSANRVRVEAPVRGTSYVGIEVPNRKKFKVGLRSLILHPSYDKLKSSLAFGLGRDVSGKVVVADLAKMPHLMIAGTTGSGKSVCVTSIITCLAFNNTPDQLRFVMLDPKKVELMRFNGLPHLFGKVEVEMERMIGTLRWGVREMERRYRLFEQVGVRNLKGYNDAAKKTKGLEPLPFIVFIIDELADLMMLAADEVEKMLSRLAQMARATGMHLIVATQRPSTDVVTGLLKANFPARIAFSVASSTDSRVILDSLGAETLLGKGDMLYLSPSASAPLRSQGVFVSDKEIDAMIEFWENNWEQTEEEAERPSSAPNAARPSHGGVPEAAAPWDDMLARQQITNDKDPQIMQAIEIVKKHGNASASLLQRKMRIGYPRAARLMDELKEMGIVGSEKAGGKTRDVFVAKDDDPIGDQVRFNHEHEQKQVELNPDMRKDE